MSNFFINFAPSMDNANNRIIGRTEELEILQESLYSEESEFIAIYGRRRVGKTFLVNRAFNGGFTFQYTGLEHKSNSQQLEAFYKALLDQGMPKSSTPKDWIDAFYQLQHFLQDSDTNELNNKKKVVFLDELPWMDAPKSGFVEALGNLEQMGCMDWGHHSYNMRKCNIVDVQ